MTLNELTDAVVSAAIDRQRFLVALAGPPAAGKTTLAGDLASTLRARGERVALVAMDGFHLDNATLKKRNELARKGAPHTFDASALVALVEQLRLGDRDIPVPGFDRSTDSTIPDFSAVTHEDRIVLIEGNYLLLNKPPWDTLRDHFDLTVFLETPLDILRQRLVQRWTDLGLTAEAALSRAEQNDLPNARTVLEHSFPAETTLRDWLQH
ncbi:MAG: uridine kinase [Pseudomonadota bacterium]